MRSGISFEGSRTSGVAITSSGGDRNSECGFQGSRVVGGTFTLGRQGALEGMERT